MTRTHKAIAFWLAIFLCLLIGLPRILTNPTLPSGQLRAPVVIEEVLVLNQTGLTDEDGEFSPWIDIVNRSGEPVELAGWSLTDAPDQPTKWLLPAHTLAPGAHLLLFASGKDRGDPSALAPEGEGQGGGQELHTSFSLTEESRFVALYAPTTRRFLDSLPLTLPPQFVDMSFGLYADHAGRSAYGYFDAPTPAAANPITPTWPGMALPVEFSVQRGLYNRAFPLELATVTPAAVIRYTTDGSAPTAESGALYETPIEISHTTLVRAAAFRDGYLPSPIATHSYIFPADVLAQPADPPGWPTTWGTHRIDMLEYRAGEPVEADYAMDPEIVNGPEYAGQVANALTALPSISLVTSMDNLDIYFSDPQARGREAERAVSVEWIYPDAPARNAQIDAGVRIQGGAGRWEYMPKHSFRLFFRNQYGAGKLGHPVFDDSPVQLFDTLILRAGVDRSFAGHPGEPGAPRDHRQATYTRDEWARASQIAMSGAGAHGAFVHLYLNGLYWGLYNLVERPDGSFMTSYFDGKKSDWFTASHGGAGDGPIDRFNVLLQLAQAGGLQDPAAYATMLEFIDPVQFSDYVILNWYAGNRDWPENNWYANVRNPAGQVRFFQWDAEDTWHSGLPNGAEIHLGGDGFEGAPFPNVIKMVFEALWANPEYRLLFADRLHRHLAGGGALSDAQAQARWLAVNGEIEQAIVAESARWGDVRYDSPITPSDWQAAHDTVLAQMAGNGAALLRQARAAGYYPTIDAPNLSPVPFQPFTLGSSPAYAFDEQVVLTFDAAAGRIYYTLDGTDPRAALSGEPASAAQVYTAPLTVAQTTTVKARLFDGASGAWSALTEVMYYPVGAESAVRFTEIMYNPPGGDGYEFVEIQNVGDRPADLSNAYFEGIDFRFPPYTVLAPGAYKTIVADFRQFRARYAQAEIDGVYGGRLSNRGESMSLRDYRGNVLAAVAYGVEQGWPLSANGLGDSLVWTRQGDPNQAHNWRASRQLNGSPGKADE